MWPSVKDAWKSVMLSIPCSFILMPASSLWVEAYNRRQSVVQLHESVSRTAIQTSLQLMTMKGIVESQGPSFQRLKDAQLATELTRLGCKSVVGGRKGNSEEDGGVITANLLHSAQAVAKGLLGNATCVSLLLQLEQDYGTKSPFHSMSTLAALAKKPTSEGMRQWALCSILDWLNHGMASPSDISKNSLVGDKHHCGLVGLFELKWKVSRRRNFQGICHHSLFISFNSPI